MTATLLMVAGEDWHFLSHRLGLARAARDAGWRVVVVVPAGQGGDAIRREGFAVEPVAIARKLAAPWTDIAALAAIASACRRHKVDLIHGFALKPALLGAFAALLTRVPAVCTVAGMGYVFINDTIKTRILRTIISGGFRAFIDRPGRAVIVQNSDDFTAIAGRLVDSRRVHLVRGSGVDVTHYQSLPEPDGIPVAVLPSRMLWDKGVGELVEAARLLKARGVALRIVLAGGPDAGNPKTIPEAQLRAWQAEGVIEWWGHQTDMRAVWAQAHIAVLPSYREGLPKALLEAASCGRPSITTDVPGCRELVENERNGLLVPAHQAAPLADALERLALAPADRARLGAEARRRAEAEFADTLVHGSILGLYHSLAAGGEPFPTPVVV